MEKFNKGELSEKEYEKVLLEEIHYIQGDFEEKLSLEILEQEEKLFIVFLKVRDIALKKKIDKTTLKNMILSEINRTMIDKHLL
ncbi:hypothetical protein ACSTS3_21715 [Aquimarina muelleri]|uniref:hypothetical protein n=1 Tax=Aquimarina muelleri TaxID=279356 RepID=UPI0004132A25